MTIIDTVTTIAEVCNLQGHNMNTLATAAAVRIFSDELIEANINNVIRFVYTNSDENLESTYALPFVVNTLSALALNNVMHEANYLPNWELVDPFDKDVLNSMIESKQEDSEQVDIIPMYRERSMLYE